MAFEKLYVDLPAQWNLHFACRVMKAKLAALCAECVKAEGTVGLGERLAAMTCLASFLSFLAFDGAAGALQLDPPLPSPFYPPG